MVKINILKKISKHIYEYMTSNKFDINKFDIKNDRKYLDFLAYKYKDIIKKNDMESYFCRSFLQYKCQMHKLPFYKKLILNFISLIAVPLFLLILIFNSLLNRDLKENILGSREIILLGFSVTRRNKSMIPKHILKDYKVINMNSKKITLLYDKDVWTFFLFIIKNFSFYFYFAFKILIKTTVYNYYCKKYKPVAIIDSIEYSFTSSIMTAFLVKKNIEYINVLHGEKLFNIRDSFFRFSECWVWDRHYINLFKKLYAFKEQFKIEVPPLYKKMKDNNIKPLKKKILKYYWTLKKEKEELLYIFNGLNKLRKKGFKITIRYHPSLKEYFFQYIYPYCDNFIVEKPENKDIYNSLLETNYAFATCSTVLLEAKMMKRIPVINDYGNNILKLEKLDYILIKNGQYITFSKLLKDYRSN